MMRLSSELEVTACEAASLKLDRQIASGQVLQLADVAAEVDSAIAYLEIALGPDEHARAVRFLETKYITTQALGDGGAELKDTQIPEWVPGSKPAADWPFWYRYQKLMKGRMSPAALQELDQYTDRILNKLGNPRVEPLGHPAHWDVRGMVAGQVQSGKTSNYIGLVCKGADAGYRLIVVLTGIHENLRVQTQERIDEGFIGKKAAGNPRDPHEDTGVGRIPVPGSKHRPVAHWGTTQASGGDFKRENLKGFGAEIRSDLPPVVLVVKKNASVLRRLLKWVVALPEAQLPGTSGKYEDRLHDAPHRYRTGCPLLVIDDEADQASVDTLAGNIDDFGEPNTDHDPTSINRLIRALLRSFDRSSYVGYTATPFANILIHDGGTTKTFGDDLFPRDFIVSLPTPAAYVGPTAIFGRRSDDDDERPVVDGLEGALVEVVKDHAADPEDPKETIGWMPPVHAQSHAFRSGLASSLKQAILDWTLAGAGLVARGRGHEHHSMLIHVTRFQQVMDRLHAAVDEYWDEWSVRVADGEPSTLEALRVRWEASFSAARLEVIGKRPNESSLLTSVEWNDLIRTGSDGLSPLQQAVDGVKVLQVHGGKSGKPLDYRPDNQLKVIAIGGNKLSRGLTIANLTVSYFLRTTRMYDTLMQMGRWFGYRNGFLDFCRLYMPKDLREWFEHMADSTEELREEFERMAAQGATPRVFGLRVRSHPIMTVTSNVKMRHGAKIQVSFSDTRPESTAFDVTPDALRGNWGALGRFVERLGKPHEVNPERDRPSGTRTEYRGFAWHGIAATEVVRFLGGLATPRLVVADAGRVASYISRLANENELTEWSVFLRNNPQNDARTDTLPHGVEVGRSRRKRAPEQPLEDLRGKLEGGTFTTKILIDSDYEAVDISREHYAAALQSKAKRKGTNPARPGGDVRYFRPVQRGLLLLYSVQPYDTEKELPAGIRLKAQDITLLPDVPLVGFAVSFPRSEKRKTVEYVVGNVYLGDEIKRMRADEELEASE